MKHKTNSQLLHHVIMVLLVIIAPAISLMAREVTEREAEDKAMKFFMNQKPFSGQARTAQSLVLKMVAPSPRAARVAPASAPAYYIYNVEGGDGFVVIAGETDVPEVLAYSLEGNFHPEYWDKGAGLFLDGYDEQIALVRSGELAVDAPAVTAVTPVLLTTANWDQFGAYFNDNYAPQWEGESCISGCVATAMAEVMQYHKWPLTGRGYHSYTTNTHSIYLQREFYKESFDWDMMPSDVTAGSPESDAVSRLMLDCGVAVEADYGTIYEETGAFTFRVAQSLRDYFYYDNPRWLDRSWTSTSDWTDPDWDNLILAELKQGRPVVVGGTSSLTGGGHCFLADGVNASGVFHYNMGWDGINNGYYTDGNISSHKYKLTEAVIGIKPLDTDNWRKVSPFTFATMETYTSIEVGKPFILFYDYLVNLGPDVFTGSLRVEMRDKNDALKEVLSTGKVNGVSVGGGWEYLPFSCTIPSGVTIEGGDRLWLYSSSDDGFTWQPVIVGDKNHSTLLLKNEGIRAGTYYIRNVATGQYLSHGGSWGTQIAVDSRGIDLKLVQTNADEGTWRIYSRFDSDGCLGRIGYVDCKEDVDLKITEVSNGIYTIQNVAANRLLRVDAMSGLVYFSGSNTDDEKNQWVLVTAEEELGRRIDAMYEATPEHPADATFLMPCPNINNAHDLRMSAWEIEVGNASCSWGITEENTEPIMEVFRPSWNSCSNAFTVYQDATLMPGRYKLQVQGFYRDGDFTVAANRRKAGTEKLSAHIFAGSDSAPLKSIFADAPSFSAKGFSTYTSQGYVPNTMTEAGYTMQQGFYENEMYFTVVSGEENIQIGVRGDVSNRYDNWTAFDNFRLTYYGPSKDAYNLTVGDNEHGSVSCLVGGVKASSAAKDDVVAISVQPVSGYSVDDVVVKSYMGLDGAHKPVFMDTIDVTYNETTGMWEFVMPDADVWIAVEYVEGTDGISELKGANADNEGIWYNLNGQPVRKPTKGIYIKNGKKLMIY